MGRGRGSVRLKRKPDYWEVRAYAGRDPATGRPRYVSRTYRGGKRDAEKLLAQLVANVDIEGPSSSHTVSELLTAHIDQLEARGREMRTIEGYRSIAAQVREDRLGQTPLRKVGVKTVDDYYVHLIGRGLSPSTVQRYHALLRAAFKRGVAWGWVPKNPVQLATPPSVPRVGRRIPAHGVVAAVIGEAMQSRNRDNGVALRLLAATGARRGEVCGLRWSEVDLNSGRIQIRAAIAQRADGSLVEKEPKSHQQREVAIDATTCQVLAEHRERQAADIAATGLEPDPRGYVLADLVADATGASPIPPNRLTQAFSRLAARVPGAEELCLHDLRHWYASSQLEAGEPLPAVAARIGDHVETLAKVYAHKGHRGDRDAAEQIGGLLGPATPD